MGLITLRGTHFQTVGHTLILSNKRVSVRVFLALLIVRYMIGKAKKEREKKNIRGNEGTT